MTLYERLQRKPSLALVAREDKEEKPKASFRGKAKKGEKREKRDLSAPPYLTGRSMEVDSLGFINLTIAANLFAVDPGENLYVGALGDCLIGRRYGVLTLWLP